MTSIAKVVLPLLPWISALQWFPMEGELLSTQGLGYRSANC